jgi:hypothetical protein
VPWLGLATSRWRVSRVIARCEDDPRGQAHHCLRAWLQIRANAASRYYPGVTRWFSGGFYVGLSVALLVALFLLWLWRPERQVRYHSEHLLRAIEHKNWSAVADFVAADYRDQWGNDRVRLLERTREVLRYLRALRIEASEVAVNIDNRRGDWIANIKIDGQQDELIGAVKEQVNALPTPFQLEWRRVSNKPWDWKLIRVANSSLELPAGFD